VAGRRQVLFGGSAAVAAALLVVAQFLPLQRTNPPAQSEVPAPAAVHAILAASCFDCHSHRTRWPWYSRVAPLSWWIVGHVNEGRADLNFSRWPTYDIEGQELALRAIEKQVVAGRMPPRSYLLGHAEARLTESERAVLLDWVRAGFGDDLPGN
jgi:hypothetical protein